jgi:Domain of unknown function (DUF1816)
MSQIINSTSPISIATVWIDALDFFGQAWWIKIFTTQPRCTYYFGPFARAQEAEAEMKGYIEDLEGESAQGIRTQIKRCKPSQLTIDHERDGIQSL